MVDCCIVRLVGGHAYSIAGASEYPSAECIPTNSLAGVGAPYKCSVYIRSTPTDSYLEERGISDFIQQRNLTFSDDIRKGIRGK